MSSMIKRLVYHKLKNLTTSEIMGYAKEYDFSITQMEAEQIIYYFKNTNFDPFNKRDRRVFFQRLGVIKHCDLLDRKSTRMNSSHVASSYAVYSLIKQITMCRFSYS